MLLPGCTSTGWSEGVGDMVGMWTWGAHLQGVGPRVSTSGSGEEIGAFSKAFSKLAPKLNERTRENSL